MLVELKDENVVIVAHSHGGNVARSASALAGETSKPRTIVTLGTPFITCDERRNPQLSELSDAAVAAGIVGLVLHQIARGRSELRVKLRGPFARAGRPLLAIFMGSVAGATMKWLARAQPAARRAADRDRRASRRLRRDRHRRHARRRGRARPGRRRVPRVHDRCLVARIEAVSDTVIVPVGLVVLIAYGVIRRGRLRDRLALTSDLVEIVAGLAMVPALLLAWIDRVCSGWDGAGISGRPINGSTRCVRVSHARSGRHALHDVDPAARTRGRSRFGHSLLASDKRDRGARGRDDRRGPSSCLLVLVERMPPVAQLGDRDPDRERVDDRERDQHGEPRRHGRPRRGPAAQAFPL